MSRPTDYNLDPPDDPQEAMTEAGIALHEAAFNLTRYFARVGHVPNWDEADGLLTHLMFSMNMFGAWLNDESDYDGDVAGDVPAGQV